MSYKTKSLLYFVCFVLSAFSYYVLDNNQNHEQEYTSVEVVEITDENLKPAFPIQFEGPN